MHIRLKHREVFLQYPLLVAAVNVIQGLPIIIMSLKLGSPIALLLGTLKHITWYIALVFFFKEAQITLVVVGECHATMISYKEGETPGFQSFFISL